MDFKSKQTTVTLTEEVWKSLSPFIRIKNKGERVKDYPYLEKQSLYSFGQTSFDAFSSILINTIEEVKGYFTESEIRAIIKAYNSNAVSAQVQGEKDFFCVVLEMRGNVFEEYEIDWKNLREKIRRLRSAQIYILQYLLKSIGSNKEDVELFINEFSKSK